MPVRRWAKLIAALTVTVLVIFTFIAWRDTMSRPVVQHMEITLPGLPQGTPPLTIVLMADIHVAGPDMPPSRVMTIVKQVNALKPDLIMIAGDFISDKRTATYHYPTEEALAPLAKLTPAIATIAVPGNHDHWRGIGGIQRALEEAGIDVLTNEARQYGPLVVGGLDDDFTQHADLPRTLSAMGQLEGGRIVLSHSPDPFPDLPSGTGLLLAGHTHCGQIRYPWGGTPATMSRYGQKYACGVVRENGNMLIASGGLGTSLLPFRFLTKPELWLITIRPPNH